MQEKNNVIAEMTDMNVAVNQLRCVENVAFGKWPVAASGFSRQLGCLSTIGSRFFSYSEFLRP